MEWLFGPRKTPKQVMRENQRALNRAIRDLDRERSKLEQQEKKVTNEIRKMAKLNQMGSVKVLARDLVRTRKYVQKFYAMRTQLQAVSLKLQTMQSTTAMNDALRGCSKAMSVMNRQVNLPAMQRIVMQFEKESEIFDMKEEMVNDTIDEAMDSDADEDKEADELVNQVLDEIGVDLRQQLADAPTDALAAGKVEKEKQQVALEGGVAGPAGGGGGGGGGGGEAGAADDPDDDDLQARFDNLRK